MSLTERAFEISGAETITIGNERFRCPEALFQPKIFGIGYTTGIQRMIYNSITKCEIVLHKDFYANIVLSGGTTKIPRFPARMHKELTALAPPKTMINILAQKNRQNSSWAGGALMAWLVAFQTKWLTKKEYQESGPAIVLNCDS